MRGQSSYFGLRFGVADGWRRHASHACPLPGCASPHRHANRVGLQQCSCGSWLSALLPHMLCSMRHTQSRIGTHSLSLYLLPHTQSRGQQARDWGQDWGGARRRLVGEWGSKTTHNHDIFCLIACFYCLLAASGAPPSGGQEGQHHFSVVADYAVVQNAMHIDFHIYIPVVDHRAMLSKHDMQRQAGGLQSNRGLLW